MVTSDLLGADRIDYLIRDSLHTGVAYGRFDSARLVNTLTLVTEPNTGDPILGIEQGGVQAVEGLLLARHFMFIQVYYHDVRKAYEIHLKDFLVEHLDGSKFPQETAQFLELDDVTITNAILQAARNDQMNGHLHARRIATRDPFRTAYEILPVHRESLPNIFEEIVAAARSRFGSDAIRSDEFNMVTASVNCITVEPAAAGYGPHYKTGPKASVLDELFRATLDDRQATLERLLNKVAPSKARDLELLSTILYIKRYGVTKADTSVVAEVRKLKPHFTVSEVESALSELVQLESELRSA